MILLFYYLQNHNSTAAGFVEYSVMCVPQKHLLCGSRKYPYPHHGGKFTKDPPASPDFPFCQENGSPPPLRIFHKYDKNPHPLWKVYFFGNKMFKNSKHKYSGCVLLGSVNIYCQSNVSINIRSK